MRPIFEIPDPGWPNVLLQVERRNMPHGAREHEVMRTACRSSTPGCIHGGLIYGNSIHGDAPGYEDETLRQIIEELVRKMNEEQ
jgi:hypothetical protein